MLLTQRDAGLHRPNPRALIWARWGAILVAILGLFLPGLRAQMLDVSITPASDLTVVTYQAQGDKVLVVAGDSFPIVVAELNTLEKVKLENKPGKVRISQEGKTLGEYREVQFWCNDPSPRFQLHFASPQTPSISYYDILVVRPGGPELRLINRVMVDQYVRGVVQSEAGHHKSLEFFKVQAVSARTYALNHKGRHAKEGFDLCDQTHCQAYKGVVKNNPLIDEAADATTGQVIVYKDSLLVEAVFSANCGGFTANSEDVWINKVDYLRAMPDYGFCDGFNNHAWHVAIPKLEFLARLGAYHKVEAASFTVIPDVSGRIRRVVLNGTEMLSISGEEVRRIFGLRSSKFHIYDSGGLLFIEGEGFGHGVGMCQDGAFHLSQTGMDFERIIKHYYQGVSLRKIEMIPGL
jgi:stage II sporulation protein D